MDKEEAPCVLPILTEIGKNYPQALYFPFLISTSGDTGVKTNAAVTNLANILHNPLLQQFVASLEKLTHPGKFCFFYQKILSFFAF